MKTKFALLLITIAVLLASVAPVTLGALKPRCYVEKAECMPVCSKRPNPIRNINYECGLKVPPAHKPAPIRSH